MGQSTFYLAPGERIFFKKEAGHSIATRRPERIGKQINTDIHESAHAAIKVRLISGNMPLARAGR